MTYRRALLQVTEHDVRRNSSNNDLGTNLGENEFYAWTLDCGHLTWRLAYLQPESLWQ